MEDPGTPASIAFSKEETLYAIGCEEGSVSLISWGDKKFIGIKTIHTDRVGALVFLDTRHFLVSGSNDKTIRFWNMHDMSSTRKISGDGPVSALATNTAQDELYAAIGSTIKIFRTTNNIVPIASLESCIGEISKLLITPDNKHLVYIGSNDAPLNLINTEKHTLFSCDESAEGTLCALHPQKAIAAVYSKKSQFLRLIKLHDGSIEATQAVDLDLNSLTFSISGKHIFGATAFLNEDDEDSDYASFFLVLKTDDLKKAYTSTVYKGKIINALWHSKSKSLAIICSDTKSVEFIARTTLKKQTP